jgi:hypothetical protein
MLTTKNVVTTQVLILGLCGLGLVFGAFGLIWPGVVMFAAAFTVFVVMSHRDRDPQSDEDRERRWSMIRSKGMFRYLFRQLRVVVFMFGPLFLFDLIGAYQSGRTWSPGWMLLLLGLMIGTTIVISLAWWYVQKRRYRNVP